jgi:hypothetical protein
MTRFGVARASAKLASVFLVALSVLVAASQAQSQLKIKLPDASARPTVQPSAQPAAQPSAETAQVQIKLPISTAELETVLTQGRELETQRRWSEAVSLYEEATRKLPGQPALEERLDLAKIHYDVARRSAKIWSRSARARPSTSIRKSPAAYTRTMSNRPTGGSLSSAARWVSRSPFMRRRSKRRISSMSATTASPSSAGNCNKPPPTATSAIAAKLVTWLHKSRGSPRHTSACVRQR